MVRIAALLCSSLLVGCTLIDQRTFNPLAGIPAKAPVAAGAPAIMPLLTIDLAKANPDYAGSLHQAVAEAVGRKPTVEFDVVSIVPATGTTAQQVAAATGITGDARDIARAINQDGVDDTRIHLSARADPAASNRQVEVFVH